MHHPTFGIPSYPPVLVVDDTPEIRRALQLMLKHIGSPCTVAIGGEDCLRLMREGFRGLVLLDINMPGLNGWNTLRTAVEGGLFQGNLFCMLTALAEPEWGQEDLAPFVFEYLAKPFDCRTLCGVLHRATAAYARWSGHPSLASASS